MLRLTNFQLETLKTFLKKATRLKGLYLRNCVSKMGFFSSRKLILDCPNLKLVSIADLTQFEKIEVKTKRKSKDVVVVK